MIRPSAVIATFVRFPASKGTRTLVPAVYTGSVAAAAFHPCPVSTLSSSTRTPSQNRDRERERVDVITFKFCLKVLDLLVLIHISLLLTYFSSLGTSLISLYITLSISLLIKIFFFIYSIDSRARGNMFHGISHFIFISPLKSRCDIFVLEKVDN